MKLILRSLNTFIKSCWVSSCVNWEVKLKVYRQSVSHVIWVLYSIVDEVTGLWDVMPCSLVILTDVWEELSAHIFRIGEEEWVILRVYCTVYRKRKLGTSQSEPIGREVWRGWHSLIRECHVQPLSIKIISTKTQHIVQVCREATSIDLQQHLQGGWPGL